MWALVRTGYIVNNGGNVSNDNMCAVLIVFTVYTVVNVTGGTLP